MGRLAKTLCVAAVIGLCSLSAASAQTSGVQIEGMTLTAADMEQLFTALSQALKPNDTTIPIFVSEKKPAEMPAYDQQSHYAGMEKGVNGSVKLFVWINGDLTGKDMDNAISSAFMLAITDGGYAGPAFKKLYDTMAQEDAQLPVGAADPFLNRHRLAAALVKQLNAPH